MIEEPSGKLRVVTPLAGMDRTPETLLHCVDLKAKPGRWRCLARKSLFELSD